MRKLEFYASMLLMLFSLIFCREAYKLSLGIGGTPGPGFVGPLPPLPDYVRRFANVKKIS